MRTPERFPVHMDSNHVYVPRAVLAERADRLAAPYRNQVGALMGDPPRGYSALDRRDISEADHAGTR